MWFIGEALRRRRAVGKLLESQVLKESVWECWAGEGEGWKSAVRWWTEDCGCRVNRLRKAVTWEPKDLIVIVVWMRSGGSDGRSMRGGKKWTVKASFVCAASRTRNEVWNQLKECERNDDRQKWTNAFVSQSEKRFVDMQKSRKTKEEKVTEFANEKWLAFTMKLAILIDRVTHFNVMLIMFASALKNNVEWFDKSQLLLRSHWRRPNAKSKLKSNWWVRQWRLIVRKCVTTFAFHDQSKSS
jgi:hypothetical protein